MKKIYISLIFSFCFLYGFTQEPHRRVVQKDLDYVYFENAIEQADGSFLLISSCWGATCDKLLVDNIDAKGNLLESYSLDVPVNSNIVYSGESFMPTENGSYNCFLSYITDTGTQLAFTNIHLESGEVTILNEYNVSPNHVGITLNDPKKVGDDYLIVGNIIEGGSFADAFLFIKIDKESVIKQFDIFDREGSALEGMRNIRDVEILDSNRYAFFGTQPYSIITDSTYKFVQLLSFFYYNEELQQSEYGGDGIAAVQSGDSTFFVSADGAIGEESITNTSNRHLLFRCKLSSDSIWVDEVIESDVNQGLWLSYNNSIVKDNNSDLILGGAEFSGLNFDGAGAPNYVYLIKYDVNFEQKWYKRFGGDYYHYTNNMSILSNGNILIYGWIYNYLEAQQHQGFYILLDNNGELLHTTHPLYEIENLQIIGNPTSTVLRYVLPNENAQYNVAIFDMLGTVLYQKEQTNIYEIDTKEYTSGQYIIRLTDREEEKIYQAKFIKQ